jgi:MATE family multidrug resistance protein
MPTAAQPIARSPNPRSSIARSPFSSSYLSASPLAQESIQRDIEECSEEDAGIIESDDEGSSSDDESEASTVRPDAQNHSMASSYRRPSFVAFGGPRASVAPHQDGSSYVTKKEKKQARREERSLLRDNHLAPPKHPENTERSVLSKAYRRLFSTKRPKSEPDDEAGEAPLFTAEPSETSALLANGLPESARDGHERRNKVGSPFAISNFHGPTLLTNT